MKIISKYEGGSKSYGLNTKDSDVDIIQRDLNDDPTEPISLEVLGVMYEYVRLETHPEDRDSLQEMREESRSDLSIVLLNLEQYNCMDQEHATHTFPISFGALVDYRNELRKYIREAEAQDRIEN